MTVAREMKGFKAYGSNKKLFLFSLPLFPISCYSWALSPLSSLYATITLMATCKRWKTTCCKQGFLLAITSHAQVCQDTFFSPCSPSADTVRVSSEHRWRIAPGCLLFLPR